MKKHFAILGLSSAGVLLGLLFISDIVDSSFLHLVGVLLIFVSVVFGFLLFGTLEDVRSTLTKPKKVSIMRSQNMVVLLIDGTVYNFSDAVWYNLTKEDYKRLMIKKGYNSYGFCCDTNPVIVEKKDFAEHLAGEVV